jgi:hypothetical protein
MLKISFIKRQQFSIIHVYIGASFRYLNFSYNSSFFLLCFFSYLNDTGLVNLNFDFKLNTLQRVKLSSLHSSLATFLASLIILCCRILFSRVARQQPGDRPRCLSPLMSGLTLNVAVVCPYGLESTQQYAPSSPGPRSLIFKVTRPDFLSCKVSNFWELTKGLPFRVHLGPIQ